MGNGLRERAVSAGEAGGQVAALRRAGDAGGFAAVCGGNLGVENQRTIDPAAEATAPDSRAPGSPAPDSPATGSPAESLPIRVPNAVPSRATDPLVTAATTRQNTRSWTEWGWRGLGLFLCLLPLGLLVVASRLEPNASGWGTHRQLGLPPCTMLTVLGVRCPSCGMTTSWAYFARGQFLASASTNLGGFWLAIFSLVFAFLSGRYAIGGRLPGVAVQKWLAISLLAIVAVTLVDWGIRLSWSTNSPAHVLEAR